MDSLEVKELVSLVKDDEQLSAIVNAMMNDETITANDHQHGSGRVKMDTCRKSLGLTKTEWAKAIKRLQEIYADWDDDAKPTVRAGGISSHPIGSAPIASDISPMLADLTFSNDEPLWRGVYHGKVYSVRCSRLAKCYHIDDASKEGSEAAARKWWAKTLKRLRRGNDRPHSENGQFATVISPIDETPKQTSLILDQCPEWNKASVSVYRQQDGTYDIRIRVNGLPEETTTLNCTKAELVISCNDGICIKLVPQKINWFARKAEETGTNESTLRRRYNKAGICSPEKNLTRKLSKETADEIRERALTEGITGVALAQEYGVQPKTIYLILRGKTYA